MASVNTAATTPGTVQVEGSSPSSLPDDLNSFYTKFESDDTAQPEEVRSTLRPGSYVLIFSTQDVVRALRRTRENSS